MIGKALDISSTLEGAWFQLKCNTHSDFNQTDEYETTERFAGEEPFHLLPLIHNAPSAISFSPPFPIDHTWFQQLRAFQFLKKTL